MTKFILHPRQKLFRIERLFFFFFFAEFIKRTHSVLSLHNWGHRKCGLLTLSNKNVKIWRHLVERNEKQKCIFILWIYFAMIVCSIWENNDVNVVSSLMTSHRWRCGYRPLRPISPFSDILFLYDINCFAYVKLNSCLPHIFYLTLPLNRQIRRDNINLAETTDNCIQGCGWESTGTSAVALFVFSVLHKT